MALQFKQTNRRQFLGRSALGAGSLLFGPLLLDSCTDHRIPPPIKPPLLGDASGIDWNEAAKTAVTIGLGEIPEVGGILSGLFGAFWPTQDDTPWNQIKDQVNQLINQKFDDYTFSVASGQLDDLRLNLQDYLTELKIGTPSEINNKWSIVFELFVNNLSSFTTTGYEVMLLPLYVQYANLYISLLRDPLLAPKNQPNVYTGVTWGMTLLDIVYYSGKLSKFITDSVSYVSDSYANGRANVVNNTAEDNINAEPFTSVNKYDRQMTMLVLDYMDTWPYFDLSQYPKGAVNPDGTPIFLFTREIYSDPYGNTYNGINTGNPIVLPAPATQFPTQLTVWAGSRIDAVQLTYPAGGGPGGVTQTPRMGDQNGGSANPFTLSPDRSITATVLSYDNRDGRYEGGSFREPDEFISTLELVFVDYNGRAAGRISMGANFGKLQSPIIGYDNYALSSIYIHGVNYKLGNSADCIVFGFMRWPRR